MSLLVVKDVRTWFQTKRGTLRAVDGVSFDIGAGRTLGLVGESGSGKSVLTRSIMGIQSGPLSHSSGEVFFDGVNLKGLKTRKLRDYWGRRIAIVPQNPLSSLNPVVRVGRQVTEIMTRRLGMNRTEAQNSAVELLDSVGIPSPARRMHEYPHQLSGGMRQRVVIAMALSGEPDLLIADEPTTALDVTIQAQILTLLQKLQRERQMAMIFVSHDFGVVSSMSDQIAVMYAGQIVEKADARHVLEQPVMPYTAALIRAIPRLDSPGGLLSVIPGQPPDLTDLPSGCPFEPRCSQRIEQCREEDPPLFDDNGHLYSCWNPAPKAQPSPATQ